MTPYSVEESREDHLEPRGIVDILEKLTHELYPLMFKALGFKHMFTRWRAMHLMVVLNSLAVAVAILLALIVFISDL
jgi:hypothetical protein